MTELLKSRRLLARAAFLSLSPARLSLAAATLAIAACGGDPQLAGIEGTGDTQTGAVSAGTVTGFGSIYVNGTRYTTDNASIISNGMPTDEESIQVGMVVQVEGRKDASTGQGIAERVTQDRLLHGPVAQVTPIDSSASELLVLGQRVIARDDIAYHGVEYQDISVGMMLDISGFIDSAGVTLATRIAVAESANGDDLAVYDLEGAVTGLNLAAGRLQIGEQVVTFENAQLDPTDAQLADGVIIEVQGTQFDSSGRLIADKITVKQKLSAEAGTFLELEGLIQQFDSTSAFTLNGTAVDASAATFRRGSARQLAEGVRVSVSGRTGANGVLLADEVELLLPSELRVRGAVDSIDAEAGTLVVLGNQFRSDRLTSFEDRSAMANRFINLSRLSPGDSVEVFAREIDGDYVVTQLRRLNQPDAPVVLDGTVETLLSPTSFEMLGLQVDASEAEGADLLGQVSIGTKVRVVGRMSGSKLIIAEEVQLLLDRGCANLPLQANCERPNPAR